MTLMAALYGAKATSQAFFKLFARLITRAGSPCAFSGLQQCDSGRKELSIVSLCVTCWVSFTVHRYCGGYEGFSLQQNQDRIPAQSLLPGGLF